MSEIRTENARIENTMLGIEDHGIMTCWVYLDYGGAARGFGGYSLDQSAGKEGHAKSILFIRKILETVGVGKWEELRGKYVRVRTSYNKVHAIGHIIEDKWLAPSEFFKESK